jgi:putative addiction module component (TIGR02574 family)
LTERERLNMAAIDYSHMTADEKFDLVDEILASIKPEDIPLTAAQEAEIERRIAMLDENPQDWRDGYEVLADLRRRFG